MFTVAVVMSTYNGCKYLQEQLDSILNQKNVEVEVFIRDDGSTDDTKKILTDYTDRYNNIHVSFGENVGVGNSFMNLLYSVSDNFDYYAFADQDDIWLDNKLAEAVKMIGLNGKSLYASNQECIDADGISKGLRYADKCDIHLTPISILEQNMLAGCTMVFGSELYKQLTKIEHRPSSNLLKLRIHDVWVATVASLYDGIIYDNRSFIKYRQHGHNVVGAYRDGFFKRLRARWKKLFDKKLRNGRSLLAQELCSTFPELIENEPLIKTCADSQSLNGKITLLKNSKKLRRYTGESRFGLYLKIIFGLF